MTSNRFGDLIAGHLTGRRPLLALLGLLGVVQAFLVLFGAPGYEMKVLTVFGLVSGMIVGYAEVLLFRLPGQRRAFLAAGISGVFLLAALMGWPGQGLPLLIALTAGLISCAVFVKRERFLLYRWLFSGTVTGVLFGILCGKLGMLRISAPLFAIFVLASVPVIFFIREKIASRMAFGEDDEKKKEENPAGTGKKHRDPLKFIWENLMILVSAVFIAVCLRVTIVDNYEIPTGSMIPNLLEGDRLFVHKFVYGMRIPVLPNWKLPEFAEPRRGDVVIFQYPCYESPGPFIELADLFTFSVFRLEKKAKNFVKRLIGIPGDYVRVSDDGELFVNMKKIPRLFYQNRTVQVYYRRDNKTGGIVQRNDIYVNKKLIHTYEFSLQSQQGGFAGSHMFYQLPADGRYLMAASRELTLYKEAGRIVQYVKGAGNLRPFPPRVDSFYLSHLVDWFIQKNMLQDFRQQEAVRVIKEDEYPKYRDMRIHLLIHNEKGEVWFRLAGKKRTPLFVYKLGHLWVRVPEGHYFMMGDNRDDSSDSREWGFVNKGFVLGGPLIRYWPFDRFGTIH